jgi:hypothetical protein
MCSEPVLFQNSSQNTILEATLVNSQLKLLNFFPFPLNKSVMCDVCDMVAYFTFWLPGVSTVIILENSDHAAEASAS